MREIFDGGPANPTTCSTYMCDQKGLTKREWFAGMALAGRGKEWGEDGFSGDKVAEYCLQQADFILKRIQEGK